MTDWKREKYKQRKTLIDKGWWDLGGIKGEKWCNGTQRNRDGLEL